MSFLNKNANDYNSLKKQRDYGSIVKKYSSKKLKPEPSELQKYYEYLTYQQPILDEINYAAEKIKSENLSKQKEDWEYKEKLKKQREETMKTQINKTETKPIQDQIKSDLFDAEPKQEPDLDPTFITNNDIIFDEAFDIDAIQEEAIKNEPEQEKLNALSYDLFDAPFEPPKATEVKPTLKVSSLFSDISNKIKNTVSENKDFFSNITEDLPIMEESQTSKKKKSGGRPKGSRTNYETLEFNRDARKLDLTSDEPLIIDDKADRKAEKEAKKAEKDAEKDAEKEAKKAEKDAEKEAKKAEKEAKKAEKKRGKKGKTGSKKK